MHCQLQNLYGKYCEAATIQHCIRDVARMYPISLNVSFLGDAFTGFSDPPLPRNFQVFVRLLSQRLQDSLAAATQVASERLRSIRIVRLHDAGPYEHKRYSSKIHKTYDLSKRVALRQALPSALFFYAAKLNPLAVLYTV